MNSQPPMALHHGGAGHPATPWRRAAQGGASDITPLTRWAKTMMMLQSAVSVAAIALVIARAVNIIG